MGCSTLQQRRPAGFSLVEMMIATLLGMLLVAWLTQLLLDTTRLNREMSNTSALAERGRLALQLLRQDLRHAGYWHTYQPQYDDPGWTQVPGDVPALVPDPCLGIENWPEDRTSGYIQALLGIAVQSSDAAPGEHCQALLSAERGEPGTDVLVVRHAATCLVGLGICAPAEAGEVAFQASNCASELAAGARYSLAPGVSPLTERDCITPAFRHQLVQNIYFIRNTERGEPALYRSRLGVSAGAPGQLRAQEIVPGVERFRVMLGIDSVGASGSVVDYGSPLVWQDPTVQRVPVNRGDGVPDGAFIHCSEVTPCARSQLVNVTAVRLYLLVRAREESAGYRNDQSYDLGGLVVGPFDDSYKRDVFTATVLLRNIAVRRERG
ncbi:pilus assembly protein PilW [Pseudohalioglobus sediminis]|uniref:Pilus assembly protein PilW n=1 Tax=Pseudohalioglobus sediminis TaxID=2606449 RepID=A0A5B0WQ15_9GAMM|nr:PilW family protein [Pseudohalioglobus sediminis]KAA1188335.1 pilus assembly protein PilW [Pseudohalioglobus sediminis]